MTSSVAASRLLAHATFAAIGTWKEKWDLLVLILILYSAVVVPVRVCYDADAEGTVWFLEVRTLLSQVRLPLPYRCLPSLCPPNAEQVGMTFCFLVDIYFSFSTVLYDRESAQWITDRPSIARNYLSGW